MELFFAANQGGENLLAAPDVMQNKIDLFVLRGSCDRLHNSTGTDATGTYSCMTVAAAGSDHSDFLQIRQPATSGFVMGVAYIVSCSGFLAANFTYLSHNISPCLTDSRSVFFIVFTLIQKGC